MDNYKIKYRPEIDGLRAIGVISVLIYHANINFFGFNLNGGFLGVDIFFVVSGYLITFGLFKELTLTNNISFKNFYLRRIRRIIPAIIFISIISTVFAYFFLIPSDIVNFSKSILFSLTFFSNIFFLQTGLDYSASDSLEIPFLHTWSLGVEEQFYFLFPIILFFLFKNFKSSLLGFIIALIILSLVLGTFQSAMKPMSSFFLLQYRLWEILIGSFLAIIEIKYKKSESEKKLTNCNIFITLGFLLILGSIIVFDKNTLHPSILTFLPVVGTALIIWFANKNSILIKALTNRILVKIGLISYSLYLVHYPIFAFTRITGFASGDYIKKIVVLITVFIISFISYYFVEKPARSKKLKTKNFLSILLVSITILSAIQIYFIKHDGLKDRMPEILRDVTFKKPWEQLFQAGEKCHNNIFGCVFNNKSDKEVIIVGDSLVSSLLPDLVKRLVNKGYKVTSYTADGCIYFPGFYKFNTVYKTKHKICNEIYFETMKKKFNKQNDTIFIFGGSFPIFLSNELPFDQGMWKNTYIKAGKFKDLENSYKFSLKEISKKNKIIQIYPVPEGKTNVSKFILNNYYKNIFQKEKDKIKTGDDTNSLYSYYKERSKKSFKLLDDINIDKYYRVYPHKIFCNTFIIDKCITHTDEKIFYYDRYHLSLEGAKLVNNLILNEIKRIEQK